MTHILGLVKTMAYSMSVFISVKFTDPKLNKRESESDFTDFLFQQGSIVVIKRTLIQQSLKLCYHVVSLLNYNLRPGDNPIKIIFVFRLD
jgi:hypothetical protein